MIPLKEIVVVASLEMLMIKPLERMILVLEMDSKAMVEVIHRQT